MNNSTSPRSLHFDLFLLLLSFLLLWFLELYKKGYEITVEVSIFCFSSAWPVIFVAVPAPNGEPPDDILKEITQFNIRARLSLLWEGIKGILHTNRNFFFSFVEACKGMRWTSFLRVA